DHTADADGNGVRFYRGKGERYRGDDHSGVNGGLIAFQSFVNIRGGYVYFTQCSDFRCLL
ncbi:MAG: hypothetical protein ACLVGL_02280, partial [Waltera sp.]